MTIVETCPICGSVLETVQLFTSPPVDVIKCRNCSWSHVNREQICHKPWKENNLSTTATLQGVVTL